MKTKQITLDDITTKTQLLHYILDSVRTDIKWDIDNYAKRFPSLAKEKPQLEPEHETIDEYLHITIDDMCIYTHNCRKFIKILEEQNDFDIFSDDNSFGSIPRNYSEAAYFALYDLVYNEVNIYSEVYNS
tara:strand:- start:746 stop:1135 length:390 start_codon:yes stop_codon:yes gene_type:complete